MAMYILETLLVVYTYLFKIICVHEKNEPEHVHAPDKNWTWIPDTYLGNIICKIRRLDFSQQVDTVKFSPEKFA